MDGGAADATLGRKVFGDLGGNIPEGQAVEAGEDESLKLGVGVELGLNAGAVQAAVLRRGSVAGRQV